MSDLNLDDLLAAIPGDEPAGLSVSDRGVYTEIRLAREEDDPSLSMRHWERPLKVADWPAIEARCQSILRTQSKDLQIAAWLTEAWIHLRGLEGLELGLRLILALVRQYWDSLHPRIDEDGDVGARIASMDWLSAELPLWLRLHVTVLLWRDRKPPQIRLTDWDRMASSEEDLTTADSGKKDDPGTQPVLTRKAVIGYARAHGVDSSMKGLALTQTCIGLLQELKGELQARVGTEAPVFGKALDLLQQMQRVFSQFVVGAPAAAPANINQGHPMTTPDHQLRAEPIAHSVPSEAPSEPPMRDVALGGWANREEAYRTLEAVAEYLSSIEPHSPTPYLVRRAVTWGRMPLPELFAEIIREEGDLLWMTKLLGLR